MSESATSENQIPFPWVPFLVCSLVFCGSVGYLASRSFSDATGSGDQPNSSMLTTAELPETESFNSDLATTSSHSATTRGEVVSISDQRIQIENEGIKSAWPLTSKTRIWKNRVSVGPSDISEGDIVDVRVQQTGNRGDGWMNTVQNINVIDNQLPSTTDSDFLVMPTKIVEGAVVETRDGIIVIEDLNGHKSSFPLQPTALVLKGEDAIALDEISAGTRVKLTTSQSGSRADGWIVTVDYIEVQS